MKVYFTKKLYQLLIFFLFGILIGLWSFALFIDKNPTKLQSNQLENGVKSFNLAVERAAPAVVNIYTEPLKYLDTNTGEDRKDRIFSKNRSQSITSLGSGVIFSSNGYILTNQHVIGGTAVDITVELIDGTKTKAKIIGIDKETDLAVLKIRRDSADLPVIEIGNSDAVSIGDIVLAVGNPYGLGQSVSMGIISATGREFNNPYSNYIQTDASINKGNSGGALIDTTGKLIGINTLIRSSSGGSEGIGLAIPSVTVLEIINDLIQFGEVKRGWLGFSIDRFELLNNSNLQIDKVENEGPAMKANLKTGDQILKINELEASYDLLFKTFARLKPGNEIQLTILRDNKEKKIIIFAESSKG